MKLQGKDIYLSTLERQDCRTLWNDFEYDFDCPAEELNLGHSEEKSEEWFQEIQKLQGNTNVRLGIFLHDGTVIGDVALQDINRKNRSCTVGMGIAKLENRSKGYGQQAVRLMLGYGFDFLGMERISANTLELNIGAQKSLEKCGFVLEGKERKAVYLNGKKYDRFCYSILKEEYHGEQIARSDISKESESERLGRLYPITLSAYTPVYEEAYRNEKEFLQSIFRDCMLRISHIGSTAVPGLISKPTIDILLEIKKDTDLSVITTHLTEKGYIVNTPPMDKIMYIKGYGEFGFVGQVFHIHVREFSDHDEFYFRDYLLAHPKTAKEYGELKQSLLQRCERDRDGYTNGKSEFVKRVTSAAREEFGIRYASLS